MEIISQIFNGVHYDYTPVALPGFFVGGLLILLGFAVMIRENFSDISVAFGLLTTSAAIALLSLAASYLAVPESLCLYWIRIAHLGVVFLPSAVYLFALAVVRRVHQFENFVHFCFFMSGFFFFLVIFSDAFLREDLHHYIWGRYANYGPLSFLFLVFFFLLMIISLRLFWVEHGRTRNVVQKKRLRAFLIAFAIAYTASVDYLPTYGFSFYPVGFVPIFIFSIICTWAIWRYRFIELTPQFAADQILEAMKGAVFVVDLEGEIRVVNEAACHMLGYSHHELIGKPIGSLFESYALGDVSLESQMRNEGEVFRDHIMGWRTRQGGKIYVSVSTSIVRDQRGQRAGVVYVALDINKLKTAEEEMRRTQAFLNSIVENIPNMIFVKDARELRFVRFNRAGEELVGYSREEMLGKNDYDFFPKEEADFFTQKDRTVLEKKTLEDILEEPIHTKEKGTRILHTKKIPILDEEGKPQYLLGISEDITEIKRAHEELRRARDELEIRVRERTAELAKTNELLQRSNKELEQFAYVTSHDLQQPLQKIVGFGDLLKSHCAETLDDKGRDYIERMQNASLRMSQLIDDILQYSRVTTKAGQFETVKLTEVVREVLSDFEAVLIESKGQVDVGELPEVTAEPMQMRQLFQNLIGNALKFHRKDEPPRVTIRGKKSAGSAEISVRDEGIGFDEKYIDKIFKPFERLHGPAEYGGSGIGLAVCEKILERHGGTLRARSQPGQGATFIVTLPLKK